MKSLQEKIAVMQAAAEGKQIEYRNYGTSQWFFAKTPSWNWRELEYRVAPEQIIDPGEGWRLLGDSEVPQKGDEGKTVSGGKWHPFNRNEGWTVAEYNAQLRPAFVELVFRRRIQPPEQYRPFQSAEEYKPYSRLGLRHPQAIIRNRIHLIGYYDNVGALVINVGFLSYRELLDQGWVFENGDPVGVKP